VASVEAGLVTGHGDGTTPISATFQGVTSSVSVQVTTESGPGTAVIIGLEATLDAAAPDFGDVFEFDLSELLDDPLLELHVFAVYSDGSKQDVTNAAAISPDNPLLEVNGPGLLNLTGVLVQALVDPEHYVHVSYNGFTVDVIVRIDVAGLSSLPIVGVKLDRLASGEVLAVGTALPQVLALLDDGNGGTVNLLVPSGHPDITWDIRPALLDCGGCGAANLLLQALGNLVGGVLEIADHKLQAVHLGPIGSILSLLDGVLTVNVRGLFHGHESAPILYHVPIG
jgi:hypothetical protein